MASSLASSSASVISLEDSDTTNESTGEHVQLIAKKNTTSEVWQYFGFVLASSLASSSASVISLEDSDTTNKNTGEHVQLIVKKNTTSEVWQYFGFVQDDTGNPIDRDSPKCKLCFENVPAKWSNTSDLYYHLKKTHQAVYIQVRAKQTMRVQENKSGCGQQILEQCMD